MITIIYCIGSILSYFLFVNSMEASFPNRDISCRISDRIFAAMFGFLLSYLGIISILIFWFAFKNDKDFPFKLKLTR